MELYFLAHPYGDDPANVLRAKLWWSWAQSFYADEAVILAPWINAIEVGGEDAVRRTEGLERNCALIIRCDCLLLTGERITPGMRHELQYALKCGVDIIDRTGSVYPPPD